MNIKQTSVELSCCSCNITYNVKHIWSCPLVTLLGEKIRTYYSNDLKPFETWVLQQYYKFCFHSKVSCNVGHDLKATILWEMTMILSPDKLNWSQGIGGWLINLQPNPENILYKIFSLIETHVTPLSANTTKIVCLGAISFLLWSTSTCLWQLLWIKIQKGIIFLSSMQCSILFLMSSPCKYWQVFLLLYFV